MGKLVLLRDVARLTRDAGPTGTVTVPPAVRADEARSKAFVVALFQNVKDEIGATS